MQDYSIFDKVFYVKEKYNDVQALELTKRHSIVYNSRTSAEFTDTVAKLSVNDCEILHYVSPVVRVIAKGTSSWNETNIENVGNALLGNVYVSHNEKKFQSEMLDFYYDKAKDFLYFSSTSFTDIKDIEIGPISTDNLESRSRNIVDVPTIEEIKKQVREKVNRNYDFNFSNVSLLLYLVPIIKINFRVRDEQYSHYISAVSENEVNTMDCDCRYVIEKAMYTLEKIEKITKIARIVILSVCGLSAIIALLRGVLFGGFIFGWIFVTGVISLIFFAPKKALDKQWYEEIALCYEFDDTYIKDNGKYTIKGLLRIIARIAQVGLPAYLALLIIVGAIFT